jgi:uncharacterized BrkB/YihY/UPF0761 family membrane protein
MKRPDHPTRVQEGAMNQIFENRKDPQRFFGKASLLCLAVFLGLFFPLTFSTVGATGSAPVALEMDIQERKRAEEALRLSDQDIFYPRRV